jgi:hypothetical protein
MEQALDLVYVEAVEQSCVALRHLWRVCINSNVRPQAGVHCGAGDSGLACERVVRDDVSIAACRLLETAGCAFGSTPFVYAVCVCMLGSPLLGASCMKFQII